ncbi:hypothetical protein [Haloarchaeobius amylolyticus]|uniref:hypothetical protein n=1 Tax=Haloarchaeobius amylolyticus TaxID=1198296 RepID=UPI00226E52D5|nr:hypothetical protein [Haloarchaeobius amylolyticus]
MVLIPDKFRNRGKRVANGLNQVTVAVWDDSSLVVKIGILILLIGTGTAVPLIPVALVARYLAVSSAGYQI